MLDFVAGETLLIDKPLTWTSFDVVGKLRGALKHATGIKRIKVGHAGTLDPLATGLLIICTGKKTKLLQAFQGEEKEYTGTFQLGATTPSFDLETEKDQLYPNLNFSIEECRNAAKSLTGVIQQQPPLFSAKRIDGKRAYTLARKGKDVELPTVQVEIKEFEIIGIDMPNVEFRIVCSKGTYIRSLARDFGRALNNGAHLTSLRRTRSGDFKIEDAVTVEQMLFLINPDYVQKTGK
jgi:tRNA pseudouridine55 synthase